MNVLFIRPSAPFVHPSSFNEKSMPLGVGFLSSILKNNGFKVYLIDRYFNQNADVTVEYLQNNKIDCVCLSLDSITISDGISLLRRFNYYKNTGVWRGRVVCGGPHVSYYPEDVEGLCDCVVVGEGDHYIVDAVNGNEAIIRSPRIKNLDALPIPDYDLLLKNKYNANFVSENAINISTSRGCPYSCSYCSSYGIWGNYYACLSAERIYEIMNFLHKSYLYTHFVFREDNFIVNKNRIVKLCELVSKNKIKFTWDCEARADSLLDSKFNAIMKDGGLKTVFVGMESVDNNILNQYNKKITEEQIVDSITACKGAGIDVFGSFIVGTPYDDNASMDKALKFAKNNLNKYKLNVFIGLPKSQLYDYCIKNKLYDYYDERTRTFYCKNYNEIVKKYVLSPGEELFSWRSSPAMYIDSVDNINNMTSECCIPEGFVEINHKNYDKIYEILENKNIKILLNNTVHLYDENEVDFIISQILNNNNKIIIRTIIHYDECKSMHDKGFLYIKNYPCNFLLNNKYINKCKNFLNVKIINLNNKFSDIYMRNK